MPIPLLGPTEELEMLAPLRALILTATPEVPKVVAQIETRFLLRDFPELNTGKQGR
jgi:hypothetical protein